jgi:hypothetical protein
VPANKPAKVAATKAPIPESEKRLGRRGQQAAAVQAGCDIAGQEKIVDFKAAAEGEQDHQPPEMGGRRQVLQLLRDFAGPAGRGRDIGSSRDADCRHPFLPCRQPISGGLPRRLPPSSTAAALFSHRVMQAGMRGCKDYIFKMAAESLV